MKKNSLIGLLCLFFVLSCQQSVYDSSANATKIYVFSSYGAGGSVSNLNFGGRSGSTTICTNIKNSYYSNLACTNIRMLISITSSDSIANMATNYGFSSSLPVYRSDGTTLVANTWSQFATGTGTLQSSIIGLGFSLPTGASTSGGLSANHCTNFTSTGGFADAGIMNGTTGGQWLNNGSGYSCSNPNDVLCICW